MHRQPAYLSSSDVADFFFVCREYVQKVCPACVGLTGEEFVAELIASRAVGIIPASVGF